jgi:lysophospholipase L1-like esterase
MNEKTRFVARTIEALRKSSGMAGSESVRLVALGDSVTAGWLEHGILDMDTAYPSLFRKRLAGLYPGAMINLINMGLGGENTEGTLQRLERDCLRHQPHLVTVCLGLNDARNGKDYLPTFRANLTRIIEQTRTAASSDILLITPNTRGDALQEDGTATEFVRAIRGIARTEDVGLADVNAIYQGAIRMGAAPADLLSNRVSHPTREGHLIFVNSLIAFFQP